MRKIKLGAIALALALSTALPVEVPYTASLIGIPTAEAGVLGSIKGAAKKVGGKVKGAAKTVGRGVVRAAKSEQVRLAGQTVKGLGIGAKEVGKMYGKNLQGVGQSALYSWQVFPWLL